MSNDGAGGGVAWSTVPAWVKIIAAYIAFGTTVAGGAWLARGAWDRQLASPMEVQRIRERQAATEDRLADLQSQISGLSAAMGENRGMIKANAEAAAEVECRVVAHLRDRDGLDC